MNINKKVGKNKRFIRFSQKGEKKKKKERGYWIGSLLASIK